MKTLKAIVIASLVVATASVLLAISIMGSTRQRQFPMLTGPYLGQKPPGVTPEIFAPGVVSTANDREFSGAFSPDGKEYYFFRSGDGAGMMVTKLIADRWTAPRPASFNSKYIDNEPHITPDGKSMFFCSNRPFPGSGNERIMTQVWFMKRAGDAWGAPKHLGMGMMPTTSHQGHVFIGSKVFNLVDDKLVEVGELDFDSSVPPNERLTRQHTCIAPDESFHIFDFEQVLYISFRANNGTWGRPIDLSQKLKLPEGEMLATLSPDNKYLFFCNRGDIYWVSAKIIEELRPAAGARQSPPPDGARPVAVLVLLGEWFGDAYFPLKDEIAARGWTMKRVGVDVEYRGCYNKKRDVVLRSDILIPDLKDFTGYDCLIIPSGPQFRKFKENPAVLKFVRDAYAAGLLVASFCVGNNVVEDAGLIDLPFGPDLFPEKVTMVRERVLIGPRGGGPPPGDGFESAPVKEICDAIARELEKRPLSAQRSAAVPQARKAN